MDGRFSALPTVLAKPKHDSRMPAAAVVHASSPPHFATSSLYIFSQTPRTLSSLLSFLQAGANATAAARHANNEQDCGEIFMTWRNARLRPCAAGRIASRLAGWRLSVTENGHASGLLAPALAGLEVGGLAMHHDCELRCPMTMGRSVTYGCGDCRRCLRCTHGTARSVAIISPTRAAAIRRFAKRCGRNALSV